jgi:hypothetical protein
MAPQRQVLALIGDIVGSRQITQRTAFNRTLQHTLTALSRAHAGILSPYTLIGDEIQAVFPGGAGIFADAAAILAAIHPRLMRFSFGNGILVTPINRQQATAMDGPAFYHARDGIERLRKTGSLLAVTGAEHPAAALLEATFSLVSFGMRKWNRNRKHILALQLDGQPVQVIARKLRLSEQAVYKSITAGRLEDIMWIFEEAKTLIDTVLEKP